MSITRRNLARTDFWFGFSSKSELSGNMKIKSQASSAGNVTGRLSITPPSSNNLLLRRTYGNNGGKSIDANTPALTPSRKAAGLAFGFRYSYVTRGTCGALALFVAQFSCPERTSERVKLKWICEV